MNKNIDYNETILEVKNLKTHFRVGTGKNRMKVKAVDDVSFSIYKKEVFGLVGESGCGKTTASRTIIRLYRPTGGDVIFEGHNIGSGHNDFYRNLKYAKINYRIDKLKTNSRKYEIYQIKERFKKEINKIQAKIDVLKEELEEKNVDINKPILEHNAKLFEKKNSFNLEKENLYFKYIHEKTNLKNLTKNEFLIEYKAMKKNIHNLYKIKLDSLKYSEGLDDETRNLQRDFITNEFEQDLAKIDKEFLPKIDERATNLMPKKEYKVLSSKLHADYKKSFASLKEEYKEYLANVDVPNYEAINKELEILKNDYKELIQKHNEDIKQLKLEAKQEINKLPKKTNIDYDKLKQVKDDYKAYVSIQKEGIRESKTKHYKKEAKLRAQKMQMIFQDPISSLNPRMTVGEIVSEGLVINGEKDKEVLKSKVIDVLELVGLSSEYISRYPHEFSGGQRQRIGIARALIMNPSFIIADEPISALDVSIRAQVLNLLTELKEKLDLTILFIAHDLSVVKFFCDRIAVMFAGKIVEMASSEDLFNYPLHPYTRSLLSAIPHPDPDLEKTRKRTTYSPMMHDYRKDKPELREVKKDHFVYCNEKEYKEILKELGKANA